MDLLDKYTTQEPRGLLDDYQKQTLDPVAFNDERLQTYMESPFAYNRVLTAEDPIEEREKLENMYHLSQYYNYDMAKVNENYDAISRHYFGEGTITTNNQAIKDATQSGKLAIEIDELKFEFMNDLDPDAREIIQSKIDLLNAQMPPEDTLRRNLPIASAKEFMRNVPNWIDVAEKTTPFKAIYDHMKLMNELKKSDPDNPLLKGNLGSAIVALVDYVSTAKDKSYIPTELAFMGGPAGITAGAWKVYTDRESASTYYELNKIKFMDSEGNEVGLDEDIKKTLSLIYGGLKSTAEVWSDLVVLKGIPGIDKIFEKAFMRIASTTGAKAALSSVLSKVLAKGAAITGSEILTEWVQASIDLSANSMADFLEEEKELLQDFKVTKEEVLSTYKEVLVKTALATAPLAFLGIGGTGIRIGLDSLSMENIIERNIAKLGDDFTTKDAINLIKEDPEFQAEVGQVPEITIIDIVNRKEALITQDFVNAMEKEVSEGVQEGQTPITQINEETGLRSVLDRDSEEFKVARETFKTQNFDQYYQTRELNEPELRRIYQETIVDFGLDQDTADQPGLSYEQFRAQRFEFVSNYINWRNTADAQKFLSTLSPAVEVIQRVIKGNVVDDAGGILIKHSEELRKIVAEAKAGGDIQTIFDYNLEKDLQIEALEVEIDKLQKLGRVQKDQNRIDQVNAQIREYIEAKHELQSSRNELSTILELVARELFNEQRIETDLIRMSQNLQERLDFRESPEYQKFLDGKVPIRKLFKSFLKSQEDPQIDLFDDTREEFLDQIEKEYEELQPVFKGILAAGRTIEAVDAHKNMLISIIQKALSNYLKINGERYIESINVKISKNISKPRADLIEKIQEAVNLVDGIKEEDIENAKEFVVKNFYDAEGKPIPSLQGPNARTIASVLLSGMDITLDENLDPVGPKLSLSDLIHLKTEVDLLRYLGKVELSEAKKGNLISDEIRKSEFLVYQDTVVETSDKKKSILKGVNFDRQQANQWAKKIFGKEGVKLFWADPLRAFNEKAKKIQQRTKDVELAVNEKKYKWGEKVYEKRIVGNHEFDLQTIMFFYVNRNDPDIRTSILYKTPNSLSTDDFISLEDMTSYIGEIGETGLIDAELKDYEKKAADVFADDLRGSFNDISVTYAEATGQRLGFLQAYFPLIKKDLGAKDLDQELAITMLRGTDQSTNPSNKNFLLERKRTTKDNAGPIRTDLFGIWQDYIQKQEHYINLNEWVRKSKVFINDSTIEATVTENYDKTWTDGIKKYIDDIAIPGRLHAPGNFNEMARRYKHNVALANLAGKSNIILRQLPSALLYVEKAGIGNWMNAHRKFANPDNFYMEDGKLRNKMEDFINEVDPFTIKSGTEFSSLLHQREETKLGRGKRKFDTAIMAGINVADRTVKTIGWTAVYDRYLGDLGKDGAIAAAREWTAQTQPSSNKATLPGMYRHSEGANILFMFTQQPVKLINHLTGEVAPNIFTKDGNKLAGLYGLTALSLSNLIIWSLTNRRVPEDGEDLAQGLLLGAFAWLPAVGRAMVKHAEGKTIYSTPQFIDPAIGTVSLLNPLEWKNSINAAQTGDMSGFNEQFGNILKGTGVAFGVPSGAISNTIRSFGEEDWWAYYILGGPLGEKK